MKLIINPEAINYNVFMDKYFRDQSVSSIKLQSYSFGDSLYTCRRSEYGGSMTFTVIDVTEDIISWLMSELPEGAEYLDNGCILSEAFTAFYDGKLYSNYAEVLATLGLTCSYVCYTHSMNSYMKLYKKFPTTVIYHGKPLLINSLKDLGDSLNFYRMVSIWVRYGDLQFVVDTFCNQLQTSPEEVPDDIVDKITKIMLVGNLPYHGGYVTMRPDGIIKYCKGADSKRTLPFKYLKPLAMWLPLSDNHCSKNNVREMLACGELSETSAKRPEIPECLQDVLLSTNAPEFSRCTGNDNKKTFDRIDIWLTASKYTETERIKEALDKYKKELWDYCLELIKYMQAWKSYGITTDYLKLGRITITNIHTVLVQIELKDLKC